MAEHDAIYTIADHEARDEDPYALGKYRVTLRWLAGIEARRVINIGCGGGVFNDMLAARGYDVLGIEPDPGAYAMASARAGSRYEVRQCGLFELVEQDARPIIVMHDVLEHIDSEAAAVSQVASVVTAGGHAVVSVPALEALFGHHDRQLGHFRRYSKRTVRRAVARSFEVERLRYYGFSGIPAAFWYSRHRGVPYPSLGGEGLIGKVAGRVMSLEERVPLPLGTSVMTLLAKR